MDEGAAPRRNHWVNHIARHAHEKPGATYLRFEGASITWAQLHERMALVAAALRQRGVRAGDRVAIMMTNRPEFLETMFAVNALGAIVVPVNFRLAPEEIASIGAIAPMTLIGGATVLLPSGGFSGAAALELMEAERIIGSVGKPVSIVAARIVDDNMKDVPPGEVGEIVYRGPSVMAGYWQNPAATAEAMRGGWALEHHCSHYHRR
jgi:fatty-acyl-CoA synthase